MSARPESLQATISCPPPGSTLHVARALAGGDGADHRERLQVDHVIAWSFSLET